MSWLTTSLLAVILLIVPIWNRNTQKNITDWDAEETFNRTNLESKHG